MTADNDEHERTLTFADVALSQIKVLRQSAVPRNYEIWYHYATGYNPSLNQTINEMLSSKGSMSESDIEAIHAKFFPTVRINERLESVGGKVVANIDQIMAVVEATLGTTSKHTENLADMSDQLGRAKDRDAVRAVIENLVQTVSEMERTNKTLESRLTASKQEITELQQNLEVVRTESLTDPLTTLSNRKFFDEALLKAVEYARESGEPMSLVMTDIDHFKRFNDAYGHLTGDQVLRLVALTLKQNIKGRDIAARYGGEEFAIIFPNTALRAATTVADQIRRAVMTKELMKRSTGQHLGRMTISLGVAVLKRGEPAQSLIERADACLYAAKRNGRNCVVCETDPQALAVVEPQVA
jgi:diguanylate cyclase